MLEAIVGQIGICVNCGERITVEQKRDPRGRDAGTRLVALVPAERFATHCACSPHGHALPIVKEH